MFQHLDWALTQVLFLYIFPSHHMNLRDQHHWKMLIRWWCRTDICSCKISAKVSLMLGNPFIVPSLCKLNHISLCFIQISTKSAYSLQGTQCFFSSHRRYFGPLGKFQDNIKISIKTARVSRLSVSYDWFNPPYSKSVKTNIGRIFIKLISKCFPLNHKSVKISVKPQ